jgi:hypothetical protein
MIQNRHILAAGAGILGLFFIYMGAISLIEVFDFRHETTVQQDSLAQAQTLISQGRPQQAAAISQDLVQQFINDKNRQGALQALLTGAKANAAAHPQQPIPDFFKDIKALAARARDKNIDASVEAAIGDAYALRNDWQRAFFHWRESAKLSAIVGNAEQSGLTLQRAASQLETAQQNSLAQSALEAALLAYATIGNDSHLASANLQLANLVAPKNWPLALRHYQSAQLYFNKMSMPHKVIEIQRIIESRQP